MNNWKGLEKNREWRNNNAAKVKKKGTDKGGHKNTKLKSRIIGGKAEGKRPLRRPRRKRVDYIRFDFGEVG
jgi:hypothetical protein